MSQDETGADVSPDTAEVVDQEPDGHVDETEVTEENEAESPPAVEDNDDETTDVQEDSEIVKAVEEATRNQKERIDKLTDNWRSTERENDSLRARIDELEGQLSEVESSQPLKTLADFDGDEQEFGRYMLEQGEKNAEKVFDRMMRERSPEAAQVDDIETAYEAREKAFMESTPDYHDKVIADRTVPIKQSMAEAIKASEIGPEIAYYLASNRDIAADIARKPDGVSAYEIGKIEVQLRDEMAKTGKSASDAPKPPPQAVKGKNAGTRVAATDPRSDKLSHNEWLRRRELELAKRQAG